MLIGKRTPTHYEITITPVTPARRPVGVGVLITVILFAVAALIGPRDDSGTSHKPERTQITDVRPHGRE
ncbi:hypothetical protein [Streptomyces sp. SYP-A7185]|uniref:hypothetical protein n=1 Tax=Streptomyces sp. SYP-A7185 TaxID=3040076 RepID=UPI0038F7C788